MLYLIGLSYIIVLVMLIHNYATNKIEGDALINFAAFLFSPMVLLLVTIDLLIDTYKQFKNKQ